MTKYEVGVLGAGQLGRMLAQAGQSIGVHCRFFDPALNACAAEFGPQTKARFDDLSALEEFCSGVTVATTEFENVPAPSAAHVEKLVRFFPSVRALEVSQDRLSEKTLFRSLGIDTPKFAAIDSLADLQEAAALFGYPAILKTRRLGYDGKGQVRINSATELEAAWATSGAGSILESFVTFDREISIIGVRSSTGEIVFYPLAENLHRDGILRRSIAPAESIPETILKSAQLALRALMNELSYVGVLALELFVTGDRITANEIAPRVHNTGHWTIDGAITSQFENHLRAGLGLPLGSAAAKNKSVMYNILGTVPDLSVFEEFPEAHLHLYGKAPAPNRKIGHLTIVQGSDLERFHRALSIADALFLS